MCFSSTGCAIILLYLFDSLVWTSWDSPVCVKTSSCLQIWGKIFFFKEKEEKNNWLSCRWTTLLHKWFCRLWLQPKLVELGDRIISQATCSSSLAVQVTNWRRRLPVWATKEKMAEFEPFRFAVFIYFVWAELFLIFFPQEGVAVNPKFTQIIFCYLGFLFVLWHTLKAFNVKLIQKNRQTLYNYLVCFGAVWRICTSNFKIKHKLITFSMWQGTQV